MFSILLSPEFQKALVGTVCFGLIGLVLMLLGFKAFDWITPKIDLEKELAENKNVAVGVVVAGLFVGLGLVVAAAVN